MASITTNLLQALRIVAAPNKEKAPHKTFPARSASNALPSGLPEITLEMVAQHDDFSDCWIVIYDRVYDVTSFLRKHPGGEDVIMDHAGRDATLAFHGTGHSVDAVEQMRDYLIGELPPKQRIFRKANNNVILTQIPD